MSCNGCRVLRKGCSESCVLRPSLQWIDSPDAQGHATQFLAKKVGRSGLMDSIKKAPPSQRASVFQSLLYEACARAVEPALGIAGLVFTGNGAALEAAVQTVLKGGSLPSPPVQSLIEVDSIPSFGALAVLMGCNGTPGATAPSAVAPIRSDKRRCSASSEGLSTTTTEKGDGIKRVRGKMTEVVQNARCGVPFVHPSAIHGEGCGKSRGRSEATGDSEALRASGGTGQDWQKLAQFSVGNHEATSWQQWEKLPQFGIGANPKPNSLILDEVPLAMPMARHRVIPPKQEPESYSDIHQSPQLLAPFARRVRPRLEPSSLVGGLEALPLRNTAESGECEKLELDLTLSTSGVKPSNIKRAPFVMAERRLGSPISSESTNSEGSETTSSFDGPRVDLSLSQVYNSWSQSVPSSPSLISDCPSKKLLSLFGDKSP